MAQPFSWELNGAVGLQHPFSPQVLWGVVIFLPLPQRFIFNFIFNALDGGCLTVSNIGAPTQEGSLLR